MGAHHSDIKTTDDCISAKDSLGYTIQGHWTRGKNWWPGTWCYQGNICLKGSSFLLPSVLTIFSRSGGRALVSAWQALRFSKGSTNSSSADHTRSVDGYTLNFGGTESCAQAGYSNKNSVSPYFFLCLH